MANVTITDIVLIEIAHFLYPLKRLDTPDQVLRFLNRLGYDVPFADLVDTLTNTIEKTDDVISSTIQLVNAVTDEEKLQTLLPLLLDVKEAIEATIELESEIRTAPGIAQDFVNNAPLDQLPKRLLEFLIIQNLYRRYRKIFGILIISGIITEEKLEKDENIYQSECKLKTIHWDRIPRYLSEPGKAFNDVYQWNDNFNSKLFFSNFEKLLRCLAIPGGIYKQSENIQRALENSTSELLELRVPIFSEGYYPELYTQLGTYLSPLEARDGNNKGLALIPYLSGNVEQKFDLSDIWKLKFKVKVDIEAGIGLKIRPPAKLQILTDLFSNPEESIGAHIEIGISRKAPNAELTYIFGSEDSSHLALKEAEFKLIIAKQNNDEEFAGEFNIEDFTLAIKPGSDADSFLQKLLSGINIKSVSDLGFGLSNKEGFYFSGSSTLEVTLASHIELGPLMLDSVIIAIGFKDRAIEITLGSSISAEIGPLAASVNRMGLFIPITFPENGRGNFGPVQINAPQFQPPNGAGFSIDAYGLIGGGKLVFDETNGRYSGVLALKFGDVSISAIGLVDTRLPDGSENFSLIIALYIGLPLVQLSFGFTLSGLGGMIAINRTLDTEVIRNGIKNGTLDSILFPPPNSIIANTSKIISDLRAVFPPQQERFIIGPMIRIGWGTPNIAIGEVGIFLELFDPVRIVLLGQVDMALPTAKESIVKVHIEIVGVLDFEKKELSLQASIDAASLMVFELYGDIALLIGWGPQPQFGMALGGFHPKFAPPVPASIFADLRRLTVCINYGFVIQFKCEGYLAITPNSLQFGAMVSVRIGISDPFEIGLFGFMGFDALFIFSPFSFDVLIQAGLSVRAMGVTLLEVYVMFQLSGPTLWNVQGKARFKIIFFDVDVGFDISWGRENPALVEHINPWPSLLEDFQRAESWGSRLPASANLVESLRDLADELFVSEDGESIVVPIIVHPAGSLEVRQNTAPLDIVLSRFGNAPVEGYDSFSIDDVSTHDGDRLEVNPIEEFFSRGQFENLTPAQKLSIPSFEKMEAGVVTGSSSRIKLHGDPECSELGYESILIQPDLTSQKVSNSNVALAKWSHSRTMLEGNAAKRSALRSKGKSRYAPLDEGMVGTLEEKFVIVDADTLWKVPSELIAQPESGWTRTRADQVLGDYLHKHPKERGRYLVIAEFEMEVAA